jgi:YD repeat-containing protein
MDADGKEVIFTHDIAGRTETIRDRTNRVTVHRYDERGNVIQTVEPDGTIQATTYHVWSDGRKSELKTSESITGLFTDANGALVQKTITTTYAYEDDNAATPPANDGLLRKVTDPLENSTTFTYDERGNLLTVTDPLERTTVNTYYPGSTLLHTTTDAGAHTTTFTYDVRGQMDTERRSVTVTDETGAEQVQVIVTDYDYDVRGRLTKLTDAADHVTTYTYDENGNQLTSSTTRKDSTGAQRTLLTEHAYDAENRLVKTWDALHPRSAGHHPASETVYDENGKPWMTYDSERRVTTMVYNTRGELDRTEYPDGTSERTLYDAEGRREFHDDRRGKRTQFVYDLRGRMGETWFVGSDGDAWGIPPTTPPGASGGARTPGTKSLRSCTMMPVVAPRPSMRSGSEMIRCTMQTATSGEFRMPRATP